MWAPMGLAARLRAQKMGPPARDEAEGLKGQLEPPLVRAKVLTITFTGLVINVRMPMSSLPPDVRCATSSDGEICTKTIMDGRPLKQAENQS